MKKTLFAIALITLVGVCARAASEVEVKTLTRTGEEPEMTAVTGTIGDVTLTTYSRESPSKVARSPATEVRIPITAATADGGATFTTSKIQGRIMGMKTIPVNTPSVDWDFTIPNEHGDDALEGYGLDRHTSSTERYSSFEDTYGNLGWLYIVGEHTFTFANLGNAESVIVYLWIEE